MRLILVINIVFCCHLVMAQTFVDIASSEGITFTQISADNLGNGMSCYDFDEDGWDDLTFPTEVDSIFFYRNVNGNFQKLQPSLYAPGEPRQISWIDYDNDGDLDLFCSFNDLGIRLYDNDGNFQFSDITASAGFNTSPFVAFGFSVADPDFDGDLDIYVCTYSFSGALNPTTNKYYENQGDGTFLEKSALYGIDNDFAMSFQSIWFDMNNDNLLDLHVINDRNPFQDEMYVNNGGGSFVPSATNMNIDNTGHFPMGVSVSDFNNDGFQDVFKSDAANGTVFNGSPLDYKLFQNNNGLSFTDVAPSMNLNHQAFAWGGLWVDYNNDCFEDLYVPTGFVAYNNSPVLSSELFTNNQGTGFSYATDSINANITRTSYSAVKGDLNRDGFYDISVNNNDAPPSILLNSGNSNNYVRITAVGTESNRMALGSTIKVYANNTCQTQTVFCGSGLCAQNSQHKIFGLGAAEFADSVVITFPNGNRAIRYNLDANYEYEILEKTTAQVAINSSQSINDFCFGDSIQIGNTGLYNYQWSTGDTVAEITVSSSGVYSFTAENLIGDSIYQSNNLILTFHDPIAHQIISEDVPCQENAFGSVQVLPNDVTLVDSIYWDNGVTGALNDSVLSGTYNYYITSNFGCVDSGSVFVGFTPPFNVQYFTTPFTDQSSGSVQFTTWGGTPPFNYNLDGIPVSDFIDTLSASGYEVIVSDSEGCVDTISFTIQNLSSALLSEENSADVAISMNDGVLSICDVQFENNYDVQIINSLGQELLSEHLENTGDCQSLRLRLESGWYIVVVRTKTGVFSQKVYVN